MSRAGQPFTAVAPVGMPERFYGWKLLAALWVILFINLAFPAYGLGVLDTYMASDLHLGRMTLGLTYAVYMSMTGIPAPLGAWCVHRFGIRNTLLGGNLLLVIGAVAMASLVASPAAIVLVAGAAVGTADAIGGPVPTQASVTRWFVRHRSFALAILLSGAAVGGFIAAPLLDRIVAHSRLGWRAGWWVIAILGVVACAVSWLFVVERPQDLGQTPDGGNREPAAGLRGAGGKPHARVHVTAEDWSPFGALRSPTFWVLMAGALGFSAVLTLFLALGISHLEDLKHSSESAALALSVSVLCGLGANLGFGYLGDRIEPRLLWAGCSALDAIGVFALLHAESDPAMFAAAALLGVAGSGCMVCMVTLLGNYFGPRAYPAVYGTASAIQSTLGAVAPILAGYWYDHHGSYAPVFVATGILCAAACIALALTSPPVLSPKRLLPYTP
jgi:MFS family permease